MRASELITALKLSELKKLALKNSDEDILAFINAGIVDLYRRFPLRRDSIEITPQVGVKDYSFADYDPNVAFDPYDNQLIVIECVIATDENGVDFRFVPSNSTKPQNFSTPVYNVLRMHSDYETHEIVAEVRLAPLPLLKVNEDLPLSPQMIELLSLFVGYKANGSISSDLKGENNSFYVRYNSEADIMLDSGQYPQDELDYSLLDTTGFV